MSATDFRRLLEQGSPSDPFSSIGVIVEDPHSPRPIMLDVQSDGEGLLLSLDYSEAGELFDTLAQAMSVVITGTASAKLAAGIGLGNVIPGGVSAADHDPDDTPGVL